MYYRRLRSAATAAVLAVADVDPQRAMTSRTGIVWMAVALLHVPLAIAMQAQSILSYIHASLAFALGLWWGFARQPHRVAWVCAYITGSEVLWRMTTDAVPWEGAKYMLIVLSAIGLLSSGGIKSMVMPILLFTLLLPSAKLTIDQSEYAWWRGQLSFNLSGPLALAMCSGFMSQVRFSPDQVRRLFFMLVLPSIAIASLVLKSIVTAKVITFTMGSNFALSGGFGPNQVSLALGLGALAAFWCIVEPDTPLPLRLALSACMLWLGGQSALTFSRGGLFGALGAALVAIVFLLGVPRVRRQMVVMVTLLVVASTTFILPLLLDFTGGKIASRFQETNTTGREVYGRQDLQAWQQNPIFGVGPGMSSFAHSKGVITHTEFTRLLAEHGSFGAFAIVMMIVFFFRNIRRAATFREKGLVASTMIWGVLYMTNAAMRTVAPAFMFGVGFCIFEPLTPVAAPARASSSALGRGARTPAARLLASRPSGRRGEPSAKAS